MVVGGIDALTRGLAMPNNNKNAETRARPVEEVMGALRCDVGLRLEPVHTGSG